MRNDEFFGGIIAQNERGAICAGVAERERGPVMARKTWAKFQDELCAAAKDIQGGNYPGDEYYRQDCWRGYWEDGYSAHDAVVSDMGYWEA